jgi:hypothetical protein
MDVAARCASARLLVHHTEESMKLIVAMILALLMSPAYGKPAPSRLSPEFRACAKAFTRTTPHRLTWPAQRAITRYCKYGK